MATAGLRARRLPKLLPVPDLGLMRDEMQYLESAGFDSVFFPDHPMLFPDPWVSLAGVADATTTLRLGALVSCVAYRHPAMLARAVADVDRMSNGRALLGMGSGDMAWEFDMLGLTYGPPAPRRELLKQTLQVVPSLLRGEPVTAEGPGFALRNTVLPAPAVQQPGVPIIVAGGSRGTLRLAAAHADALNMALRS
jgi:alkanesulfonate monooxygenase SsuD/methylene tetrahydromethanopterin reductase-like flavin-dependent oxidoreductase (luciferase family)